MEEVDLNKMFTDRDLLEELLGRVVRLEASMSVLLGEVANHRLRQEGEEEAEDMQSRIYGQIEKMEAAIYQELMREHEN